MKELDKETLTRLFLLPEIHTTFLPSFGSSFAYHGPVEDVFCQYLTERAHEEITIFLPAFGHGRSLLDVLTLNKNARSKIIANDIQEDLQNGVEKLREKYSLMDNRVSYHMGNIFNVIENIDAESVDAFFCPNLIHFFNPFQIQKLFVELYRIMKPEGRIFLSWKGMSNKKSWSKSSSNYDLELISKGLEKSKISFPRYIEKEDLTPIADVIYPYFFATTSDVADLGQGIFTIEAQGESSPVNTQVKFVPPLILGEYKYEKVEDFELDAQSFVNHVILKKSLDEKKIKLPKIRDEIFVGEFFKKRRQEIHQFLKNKEEKKIEEDSKACSFCFKSSTTSLDLCGGCKLVRYCNKECQKKAWPEHKKTCKK